MVETDVGDDGEQGGDDVCAVESSAQSHLYYSNIYLLFLEVLERQGRCQFEERRVEGFEERTFLLHEVNDALFRYHLAVDANPLAEVNKMWTRIESYLVTCRLQDCSQSVTDRPFAIGTCNVYGLVRSMRMTEMLVKSERVRQPLLICASPNVLEQRGYVEQILNRVAVLHWVI